MKDVKTKKGSNKASNQHLIVVEFIYFSELEKVSLNENLSWTKSFLLVS